MTSQKFRLKDMSWIEFRERLTENPVIILPLGSQEEQGPHAPMGDYMLTEALADIIGEKSGAIVAPILPFGYADYFRPIPGGIALRPESFKMVLEDICTNFLDHELDKLLIFNGHSGNFPLIDQVMRKLKQNHGVIVPCLNVWRMIPDVLWEELFPGTGKAALGHGGDPLTSVYKFLYPDLLRPDLIELEEHKKTFLNLPTAGLGSVKFRGGEINVPLDITDRCNNGIAGGDPTKSNSEAGKKIADYIVEYTVDFISHLAQTDTQTKTFRRSR